jgi:hypothetical protein
MTNEYNFTLDSLQHQPGETYGAHLDRLEKALHQVIDAGDNSSVGMEILAFILMEAPAEFDCGYVNPPGKCARLFLSKQDPDVKSLFREKAAALPRGRSDRIESLLRS